jgi:threonine dehydratase
MKSLTIEMIKEATLRIQHDVRKTPLEYSPLLSQLLSSPVYLKLECMQETGSFKLRGALFRLSQLTPDEKSLGVITCSAGNHGKAVAYVSKKLGVEATVYVPRDVDESKYLGILSYGAKVVRSPFHGYDDSEELARQEGQVSGKVFISPFDDVEIMAGNGGTLAQEIIEEFPEARSFILPVGGGGLAAGFSFYIKETIPFSSMIGCQHKDSPGLKLSLERNSPVTKLPAIETIAGGVEGGIGANCFNYLKTRMDEVVLVSEQEIIQGVRWMLEHHQYLIEPSSAVVIAACLSKKIKKVHFPTVIVLSGRNVSFSTIQSILN